MTTRERMHELVERMTDEQAAAFLAYLKALFSDRLAEAAAGASSPGSDRPLSAT